MVGLALLVGAGMPVACPGAQAHYYYFENPVPLESDPDWVAVFSAAGDSIDEILAFIRNAGITVSLHLDHPAPGWSLYYAPGFGGQEGIIDTLTSADQEDGARDYFFAPVFKGSSGQATMPGNAILVRWKEGPDSALLEELRPAGCIGDPEPAPFGGMDNVYRLRPRCHSGFSLMDFANALAESGKTRFSEPDLIVGGVAGPGAAAGKVRGLAGAGRAGLKLSPGDEYFDQSWHWDNTGQKGGKTGIDVDTPAAWDITTGEGSVVTVVIDVGVQQDHPDIHQDTGADFTSQDNPGGGPFNACDNHGTPVAGAVSAPINETGTVGAAPGSISRSARAFISETPEPCSGRWTTQFSWTVDALAWAQNQGARVTNNSNSYDQPSSTIASKYDETREAGMIHFASAGNDASRGANFPASLDSVEAVSAVGPAGELASFSNFGQGISMAGPGVDIHLPDRVGSAGYVTGDYLVGDGTSYASPIAAGVGALLLSRAGNLRGPEVALYLQASARDLGPPGRDDEFGWGLVNAHGALLLLDIFSDDLESGDTSKWSETVP